MMYSVIVRTKTISEDTPFVFKKEALKFFEYQKNFFKGAHYDFEIIFINNVTNDILDSFTDETQTDIRLRERFGIKYNVEFTPVNQMVFLLDDRRIFKNMSYSQIAEKTGLKISNISRFFTCRTNPTLKLYIAISNAINTH